ncbi:MAG TPA: PilZ domain-containing protein [Polyangiaceae bacterium]|nr:PilZ domain-containing protein [Polyangiaceae bacterium]
MPVIDHFRAVPRRPTSLSARLELIPEGRVLTAELVNLGIAGACVTALTVVEVSASVRLHIEAPQLWEPLIMPGTVTWSRPATQGGVRLGIHFQPDSAATLTVLTELVGYNGYL